MTLEKLIARAGIALAHEGQLQQIRDNPEGCLQLVKNLLALHTGVLDAIQAHVSDPTARRKIVAHIAPYWATIKGQRLAGRRAAKSAPTGKLVGPR